MPFVLFEIVLFFRTPTLPPWGRSLWELYRSPSSRLVANPPSQGLEAFWSRGLCVVRSPGISRLRSFRSFRRDSIFFLFGPTLGSWSPQAPSGYEGTFSYLKNELARLLIRKMTEIARRLVSTPSILLFLPSFICLFWILQDWFLEYCIILLLTLQISWIWSITMWIIGGEMTLCSKRVKNL